MEGTPTSKYLNSKFSVGTGKITTEKLYEPSVSSTARLWQGLHLGPDFYMSPL